MADAHIHLRHTFCAHMVMVGVPLRRRVSSLGTRTPEPLERTIFHLTPDGDNAAIGLRLCAEHS